MFSVWYMHYCFSVQKTSLQIYWPSKEGSLGHSSSDRRASGSPGWCRLRNGKQIAGECYTKEIKQVERYDLAGS